MRPELVFALGLVAVVALAGLGYWRGRVRREAFFAWAMERGWSYTGSDPSLVSRWGGQPFNAGGHSRRATDVLTGMLNGFGGSYAVTSFTYVYTKDNGTTTNGQRNSTTYHVHVMAIGLPVPLPTLELTHDGLGAKLAKAFGGQDIVFESDEFNKYWRVSASQLKYAHDVVRPQLMERLLRADAREVSFRIEGDTLLTWTTGQSVLEKVDPRARMMASFVESIPRFVWQDHGYDPPITTTAREGL